MTKAQYDIYVKQRMDVSKFNDSIETAYGEGFGDGFDDGFDDGFEDGFDDGFLKAKIETIKNIYQYNDSVEDISKITKYDYKLVEEVIKNIESSD